MAEGDSGLSAGPLRARNTLTSRVGIEDKFLQLNLKMHSPYRKKDLEPLDRNSLLKQSQRVVVTAPPLLFSGSRF